MHKFFGRQTLAKFSTKTHTSIKNNNVMPHVTNNVIYGSGQIENLKGLTECQLNGFELLKSEPLPFPNIRKILHADKLI